jgi:hypothetical protein
MPVHVEEIDRAARWACPAALAIEKTWKEFKSSRNGPTIRVQVALPQRATPG